MRRHDHITPIIAGASGSPAQRRGDTRRRQGYILVETLIVIAGLVALMGILAAMQRANLQDVQNRMRRRRAEVAARSAVARAMTAIQQANPNLVKLTDDWAQQGDNGNQKFNLGDATFRMQIVDAASMLNINTATAAQLGLLPLTQDVIDCLLDWRSPGQTPRSDGAKDGYYNGLQPQPYNAHLTNLTTVNELLLVKGWTAKMLYQPITNTTSSAPVPQDTNGNPLPLAGMFTVDSGSPNTRASGAARINLAVRVTNPTPLTQAGISGTIAAQIVRRAPFTSWRTLFAVPGVNATVQRQLLNVVTLTAATRVPGLINLNTASQATLQTIPNITPDVAAAIVSQQSTGLATLGGMTSISSVSGNVLTALAPVAAIGTDTWIVRSYGESGGVGIAMQAVIQLTSGQPQIKKWDILKSSGIPSWWVWQDQATSTIEAGTSE